METFNYTGKSDFSPSSDKTVQNSTACVVNRSHVFLPFLHGGDVLEACSPPVECLDPEQSSNDLIEISELQSNSA